MSSRPPVVTDLAELSDAARECPALSRAQVLGDWIGAGRGLTTSGVLKPADAIKVCALLGIELPASKPRSALDIDGLMTVWATADRAGFIDIGDREVRAGVGLREWRQADAEHTVASWTRCVLESLGLAGAPADEPPDLESLAALCALFTTGSTVGPAEVAASVAGFPSGAEQEDGWCPDCGEFHGADVDGVEAARGALLALVDFGIVTLDGDTATGTPLGHWLTNYMFRDSAPPADVDAAALVEALGGLPPMVVALMARPWLDARTPTAGADQLLTFAEGTSGSARLTALALAEAAGPAAAPVWREWRDKPGFGAYARAWLADADGGELSETDETWLTVDALSSVLDALSGELPAPLLSSMLVEQVGPEEIAEVLPMLTRSGHPAADRLAALLTGQQEHAASDSVYQLKITLRGVSKPPVWRRVLVPADIRLDQLHGVIQTAMGWYDGHLHVFSNGWAEYGLPDPELGHGDERAVRLAELLNDSGDKLRYTYDFGDDWEHDVLLEKVLPADPGTPYPACTAGKGACPPEDCGGIGGYAGLKETLAGPDDEEQREMLEWLGLDSAADFDPTEFSVEETSARLRSRSAAAR